MPVDTLTLDPILDDFQTQFLMRAEKLIEGDTIWCVIDADDDVPMSAGQYLRPDEYELLRQHYRFTAVRVANTYDLEDEREEGL